MYRNINLDKNRPLLNHFFIFQLYSSLKYNRKRGFLFNKLFYNHTICLWAYFSLIRNSDKFIRIVPPFKKFYILSPFVSFILNTTTTFHIIKVLTHKSRKKQNNNSLLSFRWLLRLIIDISLIMTLDLQTQLLIFL